MLCFVFEAVLSCSSAWLELTMSTRLAKNPQRAAGFCLWAGVEDMGHHAQPETVFWSLAQGFRAGLESRNSEEAWPSFHVTSASNVTILRTLGQTFWRIHRKGDTQWQKVQETTGKNYSVLKNRSPNCVTLDGYCWISLISYQVESCTARLALCLWLGLSCYRQL